MTFKTLAQRLFFLQPLLNLIFIAGIILIIILFIYGSIENQNTYALPFLLFAVWSLLLSALIGVLVQTPSSEKIAKGWFSGLKNRLGRALFSLVLLLFILISLALLYATIKLLNL
tara:strand:- start:907 stop:1251 length:345 start_codon:yes stop_codon:yes gene_type:complete